MTSENAEKPDLISWILLLLLAAIWGSSYILIKYSMKAFGPLQLASTRVFIAFVALAPFLFVKRFRDFNRSQLPYVILIGLLGSFIPAILFALAQTKIDSSLAAILNALVPLSTLVLGVLFFGSGLNASKVAGVTLGIIGSAGIIFTRSAGIFDGKNIFALFVIAAGVCYALQTNIIKRHLGKASPLGITAWSFAFIGPLAGIVSYSSKAPDVAMKADGGSQAMVYLTVLAVAGTAVAIVLFNRLIQQTTPLFASTVTYLIPLVAIAWGINDGEVVTAVDIIGLVVILIGIYLTGK